MVSAPRPKRLSIYTAWALVPPSLLVLARRSPGVPVAVLYCAVRPENSELSSCK